MRKALTYLVAAASIAAVTPAFAAGDAAAGEKVFNKCKACHSIGEGAKNKVGPELNGIVGRPAGSIADFKYSDNIKELAASGFVWDEANLTDYLTDPNLIVLGDPRDFGLFLRTAPYAIWKRGGFGDYAQWLELFGMQILSGTVGQAIMRHKLTYHSTGPAQEAAQAGEFRR